MNPYIQQVNRQLQEYRQQCGAAEEPSVLALLWENYVGSNPMSDSDIRQTLEGLKSIHEALSIHDSDRLNDLVLELSYNYEWAAFLEGIRIGAHLQEELDPHTQKCTP